MPRAALLPALGLALAGCAAPPAASADRCGLGAFQGEWVATSRGDERLRVSPAEVAVTAGPATTRLAMRPERDIAGRSPAELAAAMPQLAALYPAALGAGEEPRCVLLVPTPGGSLALLPGEEGLLRLEEARSDPPVVQRLRRAGTAPSLPPAEYGRPPR